MVPDSVADPVGYYRANVAKSLDFVASPAAQRLRAADLQLLGRDLPGQRGPDRRRGLAPSTRRARTRGPRRYARRCSPTSPPPSRIRVLSLRYFNPIGADPKMRTGLQLRRPTHALGKMIQAHEEGTPFLITGTDWPTRDGSGIRDYIHVWDLAAAHVAALTRFDAAARAGDRHQPRHRHGHHGPGTSRRVQPAWPTARSGRARRRRRPGDIAGAYTRIDRAERLLGWRPQLRHRRGHPLTRFSGPRSATRSCPASAASPNHRISFPEHWIRAASESRGVSGRCRPGMHQKPAVAEG